MIKRLIPWAALLLPALAFAQTFEQVINGITFWLNRLIPFLILLATVLFLWGVVMYITAGGDEARAGEGRKLIMWGIVFLAVMIAVWGFVNVLLSFIFNTSEPFDIQKGPQQGAI